MRTARRSVALVTLLVAAVLAVTTLPSVAPVAHMRAQAAQRASRTQSPPAQTPAVSAAPQPLSLQIQIGQMLAVGVYGTDITPGLRHLILDDKVGSVILFRSNFGDAAGVQRWCTELQQLGRQAGLPAPLLVMLDEEGGDVRQVQDGIVQLPSARDLGAGGPAAVGGAVAQMARGLGTLGVALDLAPVADLRTNPGDAVILDRSFGADPAAVAPLVAAYVRGLHDGGVAATLKHFPGLGGAAGDPHRALPTDSESLAQWAAGPAVSFSAGIDAGADAVMTTAVRVPGLDPSGTPAIFSRPVVTGLLRDRLHFPGVIISDSLVMAGVNEALPQATVDAALAGNDLMLLADGDTGVEQQAVDALMGAVTSGRLSRDQVAASAARVIELRRHHLVVAALAGARLEP